MNRAQRIIVSVAVVYLCSWLWQTELALKSLEAGGDYWSSFTFTGFSDDLVSRGLGLVITVCALLFWIWRTPKQEEEDT